MDEESNHQFERRKADHIRLSLSDQTQARGLSGLDHIDLTHEALPDLNFDEVSTAAEVFGHPLNVPYLISSMTAGHAESTALNRRLVEASARRGWCVGVGSQRRELNDPEARAEWAAVRKNAPGAVVFGNLGIAQLIRTPLDQIRHLCDAVGAAGLFIHLNALQECLQPEGTPRFRGGLEALTALSRALPIPVMVKETGCGFSPATLARLATTGVRAVDVSGLGGTHWGRVEGGRAVDVDPLRAQAAQTFGDWGVPTVDAVLAAMKHRTAYQTWASGGVRTGLDAGKLIALGSSLVGFARPILEAAVVGEVELDQRMARLEFELRTVLFCTGAQNIFDFQSRQVWTWRAK